MDREVLALKALADLRQAAVGLLEEKAVAEFVETEHPRGREGRFRSKPKLIPRRAGDVTVPDIGERPPWNPVLDPNIAQRVKAERLDEYPPVGPAGKKLLGSAKDTQSLHSYVDDTGKRRYSAERKRLHDQIVGYFLSSHKGDPTFDAPLGERSTRLRGRQKPAVLFYAGGTATGKTTSLNQARETGVLGDLIPEGAVMVNADMVKQMLPEFKELSSVGERGASLIAHEESSDIAARIRREAVRKKLNLVVDGTGDSGRTKFMRKLWDAADEGYDVKVFMVDLPLNVAVERSVLRGDVEGRYVPVPEIEKSHYGSAARHLDWRDLDIISSWQVWSNNVPPGEPPILAASGGKGHFLVHDRYEYDRILEKTTHSSV